MQTRRKDEGATGNLTGDFGRRIKGIDDKKARVGTKFGDHGCIAVNKVVDDADAITFLVAGRVDEIN